MHLKGFRSSQYTYSVPEWIASFYYADFIITDSFHGVVFSILFEKNFIVVGNYDRGIDRFTSLLALFNISDRMVFSLKEIKDKKLDDINYQKLNEILYKNKDKSYNYLIESLSN